MFFENQSVDARFAPTGQIRLIYVENPVERSHVEHEFSGLRRQRAADAAASAHRRDPYSIRVRPAEDRGHLLAPGRAGDQDTRRCDAGALVHDAEGPVIADRSLVKGRRPDDLLELRPHWGLAAKRPASQPVRIGTPKPQGPLYS